jgi:hypothetical protein
MSKRPSPAVQLARDVLHYAGCPIGSGCARCRAYECGPSSESQDLVTLARALIRAVRK